MQIDFSQVIVQLLVMMFIILVGMVAKRFRILDAHGDKVVSSLIVNITTPALIISSMTIELDLQIARNILITVILTIFMLVFAYFFSKLAVRDEDLTEDEEGVYRFATIFGNVSFLGFPMCYALFGKLGLLYASVYSAIQDIFFWSVGVDIMSGNKDEKSLKAILNPNLIAIAIGFIILFANIDLPEFLDTALSSIGNATMPLALMMVGSGFSSFDSSFVGIKSLIRVVIYKLLLMPIIASILLLKLPIDDLVKYVLLLEFAIPTAAASVVMARNYDKDFMLASKLVMATTLLSMITIPLLVLLAKVISGFI